ncbi:MAG: SDR family oxidoreductase [Sphingomonadales bacterium]|nr:SDR family oxidoreductase [Sphingomonadales bacterium]
MDLNGKVAVVTGGGSGIGAGIAEALLEKGAKVAIADISAAHLAEESARLGGKVLTVVLDVTDPASWAAMKAEVEGKLGPVDVLVNNAGLSHQFKPIEAIPEAEFDRLMAVNVKGVFLGCQAFAADLKARGSGHVVNVSSANGLIPFGTFSVYSASKFAVAGMSEALQQELAPHGVGVSILYPGLTRSRMSDEQVGKISSMVPMEAVWLGRAVCRAIEDNRLHVISHPDMKPVVERRIDVLFGDFGEPAEPGYKGAMPRV